MRLGVNIPDDLLQRLEPLKQHVNISQLCREAIQAHVSTYERVVAYGLQAQDATYARLKDEAPKEIDWELFGIEDAVKWADKAPLKEYARLFQWADIEKRDGNPGYRAARNPFWAGSSFWDRQRELRNWFIEKFEWDELIDHQTLAETAYLRGWFYYVSGIWDQFRTRVREEVAGRPDRKKQLIQAAALPTGLVKFLGSSL